MHHTLVHLHESTISLLFVFEETFLLIKHVTVPNRLKNNNIALKGNGNYDITPAVKGLYCTQKRGVFMTIELYLTSINSSRCILFPSSSYLQC